MAQRKTLTWTNPSSGTAARNQSVGFSVSKILVTNVTDGGQFYWNSSMPDGYYVTVSSGNVTTTNGFTPLSQSSTYGATVSGFTNANTGVITVNDTATFGFAVGDTIKVAELADDLSGTNSLNNTFVIQSLTATTITTTTDTSVTGYSVYVSGGVVTRVSDVNGFAIATQNFAIQGILIGTGVVGTDSDVMVAEIAGDNNVV